jgi:hypothetical protein
MMKVINMQTKEGDEEAKAKPKIDKGSIAMK